MTSPRYWLAPGKNPPGGKTARAASSAPLRADYGCQAQFPGTNGQVQYSEGINVGYRSYDARNITPLFPFGYGLSYTTFAYSNINVGEMNSAGDVPVSFTITNTGTRTGAEVGQVYVSLPANSGEPPKTLQGFKKVTLAASASTQVNLTLPARAFRYWGDNGWSTPTGNATISVGSSSRDIKLTGTVALQSVTATPTPTPTTGQPINGFATVQAEAYSSQSGTQLENTTDTGGGQDVAYISNGDTLTYDQVAFPNSTATSFSARVASAVAGTGGSIEVHTGSARPLLATVPIGGTGGWQNWQTVTASIPATTAQTLLVLKFVSSATGDFVNLNWFTFGQGSTNTPPSETPLSRTGWVASASLSAGQDVPANAIDTDPGSRWSTGSAMADGQTFTLDLGTSQTFNQVIVDAGSSTNDYARGLTIGRTL